MYEPDIQHDIEPVHIANKIKLLRDYSEKCFVVVEGKSDKLTYHNFLDQENCEIIIPPPKMKGNGAKDNVISIISILDEDEDITGYFGIVDNDFWKIDGVSPESNNILTTDSHDIETMIFTSEALDKVLAEFGSEEKIIQYERGYKNIRQMLFENGLQMGYLRWVNDKETDYSKKLSFNELDFSRFINRTSLTIDVTAYVQTVINKSSAHHIRTEDLRNKMEQLANPDHDASLLSCGHDLVSILSFSLRRILGTNNGNSVSEELLEKSLRLAYEFAHFKESILFNSIVQWQESNLPFIVLKTY